MKPGLCGFCPERLPVPGHGPNLLLGIQILFDPVAGTGHLPAVFGMVAQERPLDAFVREEVPSLANGQPDRIVAVFIFRVCTCKALKVLADDAKPVDGTVQARDSRRVPGRGRQAIRTQSFDPLPSAGHGPA